MSNSSITAKADRNTKVAVATEIETLSHARKAWEEGTYKKNKEELYQLLDDCLKFYLNIRSNKKKCKALNALLNDKGIKFNLSTSLQTRIVRLVFGAHCRKRAYAYARVITVAADEKKPTVSMPDFIDGRGGIEEIRRTKQNGKSPADVRKENIEFAVKDLEKSQALTQPFKVEASRREQPEDTTHDLFVAIMRQESDGSYSLVYETSAHSVVNTALAQAGKDKGADANIQQRTLHEREAVDETLRQLAGAIDEAELDLAA